MHDAYTPTFFTRHNRPLRGVMIDNQPWFAAYDFARLFGLHHPQTLPKRLKPHETRRARLRYSTGSEETLDLINEAGLYKALIRFGHPECRQLDEWLTREVIPTLRDQHAEDYFHPRRVMLSWQSQRLMLLEWQGELWMPWRARRLGEGESIQLRSHAPHRRMWWSAAIPINQWQGRQP